MELVGVILRTLFFELVLSALELIVRGAGRVISEFLRFAMRLTGSTGLRSRTRGALKD
ncbi:MAG: hypothetical protein K0S81_90 [Rhodospirillales bacterium]|jgi:hypothetical protein|nr:hypothetical protein [Rhodospirillales bacterium]